METCCHSNFCERPSVAADVKNSKRVNDNNKSKMNAANWHKKSTRHGTTGREM